MHDHSEFKPSLVSPFIITNCIYFLADKNEFINYAYRLNHEGCSFLSNNISHYFAQHILISYYFLITMASFRLLFFLNEWEI